MSALADKPLDYRDDRRPGVNAGKWGMTHLTTGGRRGLTLEPALLKMRRVTPVVVSPSNGVVR